MLDGKFPDVADDVEFVTRFDNVPMAWQYLGGLDQVDVPTEVTMNDIDASATMTTISFLEHGLVIEGDGTPIDEMGWKRLCHVLGAGDLVPAKRRSFGIKNHGLKSLFTVGDDIRIRSAGKMVVQTLWAKGRNLPPKPGTLPEPVADPAGPTVGCRIEVPYRRETFRLPHGEELIFEAMTEAAAERMFTDAVRTLPERLIGIIRPIVKERYVLRLEHHRLGRAQLEFRCHRVRRLGRRSALFQRSCRVEENGGETRTLLEQSLLLACPEIDLDPEVAPDYFLASAFRRSSTYLLGTKRGAVVEASWVLDRRRRPLPADGRLRYPIAYAGQGETAGTSIGVHFTAPFISDAARHGVARQAASRTAELLALCEFALCEALEKALLPRHGGAALSIVCGTPERMKPIVERLIAHRAMPAVRVDGRRLAAGWKPPVVVPAYRWEPGVWDRRLAAICPAGTVLLDPKTPPQVTGLLGEGKCAGFLTAYSTFDEAAAVGRLTAVGKHYPWPDAATRFRALSDPGTVNRILDALLPYAERLRGEKKIIARANVELPDSRGKPTPLLDLKLGIALPSGLPGFEPPPVLHPEVASHAMFRTCLWRLPTYGLNEALDAGVLKHADTATRTAFFAWLIEHERDVDAGHWQRLKGVPVWPDATGEPRAFEDLCRPESGRIAALFRGHIHLPHASVTALVGRLGRRRIAMTLRLLPTTEETSALYVAKFGIFRKGAEIPDAEIPVFRRMEESLRPMRSSERLLRRLKEMSGEAVALSRDRVPRVPGEMLRETPDLKRLALPPRMLLDRAEQWLDEVHPPLQAPTAAMLATTLREDSGNVAAHLPRLRALYDAARQGVPPGRKDSVDLGVGAVRFIPVGGQLMAPEQLALFNAVDFWGGWKTHLACGDRSHDDQKLYKAAGVIASKPTQATSLGFFLWLKDQPLDVVARHVPQVLRHLADPSNGPLAWWKTRPDVPCIPARGANGIVLLPYHAVVSARARVFVDDFEDLGKAVRATPDHHRVYLAIDHDQKVATPLLDRLLGAGVRSLREAAGQPMRIRPERGEAPSQGVREVMAVLAAPAVQRTLAKRLVREGVKHDQIDPHWRMRIKLIADVRMARRLKATFRLAGRGIDVEVSHAFDEEAGTLWVKRTGRAADNLMEALAELIFRPPLTGMLAGGLARALRTEFEDSDTGAEGGAGHAGGEVDETEEEGAIGESGAGHGGGPPDPARNVPQRTPVRLGNVAGAIKRNHSGKQRREFVPDETAQIAELKANHYAWHCQIDLALKQPAELAPPGSYVDIQENRYRVMDHHHADPINAGGARHAGNILILGHYLHRATANSFSRAQVTEALRRECRPRTIRFGSGNRQTKVTGVVAEIGVPATGETIPIFFTEEHRRYWLEMAKPNARVTLKRGPVAQQDGSAAP